MSVMQEHNVVFERNTGYKRFKPLKCAHVLWTGIQIKESQNWGIICLVLHLNDSSNSLAAGHPEDNNAAQN